MYDVESSDLGFRTLDLEDVTDAYVGWLNDPEINRFLESRHEQHDEDTVAAFVEASIEDPSTVLMGVFDRASGQHIGNAKLSGIEGRYRIADLGFLIGEKEFHGQGLGTQIVATMTEIGLVDLSLRKITAGVYEPNTASLHCFLNNEFREEGFLREHYILDDEPVGVYLLGRLRDDW